jgi:hypothetical protein
MDEQSRLRFEDLRPYVAEKLGAEGWLTVYEYIPSASQKIGYFCALATPDDVERCLSNTSWDLMIGNGLPGFVFEGDEAAQYLRFGNDIGIEPFIFCRDFHGLKPDYREVSEEFRHFHNLFEDRKTGSLIALDDNGDEVEVVRVDPKKVQVRSKYLKDYLAARNMCMLIFFEYDRWSPKTLDELGLAKEDEDKQEADHRYVRWIAPWPSPSDLERKAFARMLGKKVVLGTKNYRPSFGWDSDNRRYEQFIIGVDGEGDEILYTCDDDQLANYFGKNPKAPHYLTPVFFRKEVLGKYYADPTKYRVEDGHVYCGGLWALRMDNNHQEYVVVYLGDLGHLASKEQLYWKSYNVVPDGGVSEVAYRRGILGEFTNPDEPALAFKLAYSQFCEAWQRSFGWDLFKPLSAEDEHHWKALHVPASGNQKDFDEQVMALSKLMVERLNEKELAKHIQLEESDKGITKFGKYLDHIDLPKDQPITFLRNLNGLRTGPAHVKGKDYQRAAEHFDVLDKGFVRAFADMLTEATTLLVQLHGLTAPPSKGVATGETNVPGTGAPS